MSVIQVSRALDDRKAPHATASAKAAAMTGALILLATVQLMVVLDTTIVNVALPTIQSEVGFSTSGIAWVVNGYALTFGAHRQEHLESSPRRSL